ncbi:LLM class flavin-dependent oxidoreductase [Agrobacterium tumefaciens]|uniref:LLM class flavin-dependent oxidoreductase n=1 Tax=Agrobacterium tumefaciens TaxID=358 RepID=UPI0015744795|nr:LLM class flavin-dependent oxidoreductase [Agrobacterium tumefaciens]NTE56108.1 LLM class flavin-dependent oxidoreductase [Agrobacterium tumefaciens]NTE74181.1 LLM class flavin-dependent oxidoreductase [Agrobacterium tumefaciens]
MSSQIIGTRIGTAPVPVSILDFAMAGQGLSARDALAASVELARLVDRRGFTRYWVAEHHSSPGVTTSSPPMLLARLVSETRRIRLGAGGMMLPNFPPLVVAEQFGLLASMAPGRIDLGIGRALGTDMATAAALRRGQIGAEDFPVQLMELLAFLDADFPGGNPYGSSVHAVPGPWQDHENGVPRSFQRPPVWLLGSSGYSAQLAAHLGFPFAFAAHLADQNLDIALDLYRSKFRPSAILDKPYVIVSSGVMAADDEREAERQSWAYSHAMMRMSQGKSFVVPTPENAEAYSYTAQERQIISMWDAKTMKGTGEQVAEQLNARQKHTNADEMMILNLGHTPLAIHRSTELIADAYDMPENMSVTP